MFTEATVDAGAERNVTIAFAVDDDLLRVVEHGRIVAPVPAAEHFLNDNFAGAVAVKGDTPCEPLRRTLTVHHAGHAVQIGTNLSGFLVQAEIVRTVEGEGDATQGRALVTIGTELCVR